MEYRTQWTIILHCSTALSNKPFRLLSPPATPPNRTTKDFTAYSIDWVLISWLTIRHLPHEMNCTYFTAFSINWVLPRRSHHEALTSEAAASAPIASPSLYAWDHCNLSLLSDLSSDVDNLFNEHLTTLSVYWLKLQRSSKATTWSRKRKW
jgi:hypothetical protein